jgi:hypothetical protein
MPASVGRACLTSAGDVDFLGPAGKDPLTSDTRPSLHHHFGARGTREPGFHWAAHQDAKWILGSRLAGAPRNETPVGGPTAANMRFRSRGTWCPSCAFVRSPRKSRGRREGRELAAPMARLQKRKQAAVTTGSAETSRPSLREWVTAYTRSPRGPALLPPSPATPVKSIANLASAPGCQDHTTSPSVTTRVRPTRLSRPSQPASTFVTTRTSLFDEAGWRLVA